MLCKPRIAPLTCSFPFLVFSRVEIVSRSARSGSAASAKPSPNTELLSENVDSFLCGSLPEIEGFELTSEGEPDEIPTCYAARRTSAGVEVIYNRARVSMKTYL